MPREKYSKYSYEELAQAAALLLEDDNTLRKVENITGIPKSTLHTFIQRDLKYEDKVLYSDVSEKLTNNFNTKYLRGGEATKQMYLRKRLEKESKDTVKEGDE